MNHAAPHALLDHVVTDRYAREWQICALSRLAFATSPTLRAQIVLRADWRRTVVCCVAPLETLTLADVQLALLDESAPTSEGRSI